MGIQKPSASKAPAFVAPVGGYHSQGVIDPCCIPGGVTSDPITYNASKSDSTGGHDATHHIMQPGSH